MTHCNKLKKQRKWKLIKKHIKRDSLFCSICCKLGIWEFLSKHNPSMERNQLKTKDCQYLDAASKDEMNGLMRSRHTL